MSTVEWKNNGGMGEEEWRKKISIHFCNFHKRMNMENEKVSFLPARPKYSLKQWWHLPHETLVSRLQAPSQIGSQKPECKHREMPDEWKQGQWEAWRETRTKQPSVKRNLRMGKWENASYSEGHTCKGMEDSVANGYTIMMMWNGNPSSKTFSISGASFYYN